MNLKRLWCLLVIIAFSMPLFAAEPGQIDSFDDINDTNWVETVATNYGDYMRQALVGGVNEVTEGTGSMRFAFTDYVWPDKDDEVIRTFSPALDFNNYEELAITLWVWIKDPNDTRRLTFDSRLKEITLYDGSDRRGRFPTVIKRDPFTLSILPLKNVGWNKVIAPLRNFAWEEGAIPIDPNVVDWNDIRKIGLWARTEEPDDPNDQNDIYIDDMRLEWAPNEPAMPYQLASFDDINDELWDETHGTEFMVQTPPGDPCMEGTSSMMIDFNSHGAGNWDITPTVALIPALDFTDGNDWAITMWVWTDLVEDAYLWEIIVHDVAGNQGRYRVPRADINTGYGWNKITARIDELLWDEGELPITGEACLDAIVAVDIWTMSFPYWGNNIYLDDLRIEPAVEALSEAVVYNADYGTITVDADAADWAGLVDSDIIDFDLTAVPDQPKGDLHVKYRLAWDENDLYILVEEQPGDNLATEANEFPNPLEFYSGGFEDGGTYFDSLALSFDFTNTRLPGVNVQMGLWLFLGLSSDGRTDFIMAMGNGVRGYHISALVADSNVATSGTLGSRVIEARLKWSVLDSAIDSWFQPAGGIAAAVQPGYIFGCDPRLQDRENLPSPPNPLSSATHGLAWFTGSDMLWPQGEDRWPTGRDTFSTDIRLVCSAGDLDFDCDVDFVDYAQLAAEWYETDCNSLNDFCNGADIIIDGAVTLDDLARFTKRWLD